LVDLDGDGRTDVLSGSWPGEVYFFQRKPDGTFAAGQTLKHPDGKAVNVGRASTAFAVDWDGDGRLDLLVGNLSGEVFFLRREQGNGPPVFAQGVTIEVDGKPLRVQGDAAPVVADWDGDGKPDLLVGAADGSIVWYRNVGTPGKPKLQPARTLIGKSPAGWDADDRRRKGEWGIRVKFCVFDWDGDGRLAILLGDRCGGFQGKPTLRPTEKAEERSAAAVLPGLRKEWAATFRAYRAARGKEADSLRARLGRLKDEIARVEEVQERYRPYYQSHGFVWLFRRASPPRKP
jgi:hypothetical protein